MFSMCSKLTPRARIPDTRIPQLMQPWWKVVVSGGVGHLSHTYLSYIYICPIYICPILVVVEGSSGWRCGPFVLILPPHTSPTPCGNISPKYQENLIMRHID